ncbi:MAG: LPS assembly protein LptD [Pseudomonadota bacterium]
MALTAVLASAVAVPTVAQQRPLDLTEIPRDLPVALIADDVRYEAESERLIARGNVEVFYGERTLTADEIVYDAQAGTITATGDLILRNPDGTTVYADIATLDPELRNGLVQGARTLISSQFRVASVEARRVESRYNTLYRAVASACEVCEEHPTPIWQIRAERVIHDEQTRQIHYENAYFDVFGVTVAWLPYFRHPDPSVERATGFLSPRLLSSEIFGYGTKIPYFVVIDDQSDATITPFITTNQGLIMEGEYRRRFARGYLDFYGSITPDDDEFLDVFRGHLDVFGSYFLTDTIQAYADINAASDDSYLREFDFSETDRLTSVLGVASFRPNGFWELNGVRFQSLRDAPDELPGLVPNALPEFEMRQIVPQTVAGGTLAFDASGYALFRNNSTNSFRFSAEADWERDWITPRGLVLRSFGEFGVDLFGSEGDDVVPDGTSTRFRPLIGGEVRYPTALRTANAMHYLEPIAQLIFAGSGGNGPGIPNEDSLLVEFDETNLFDISRFPGEDRFEPGFRSNVGVRYERVADNGTSISFLVGNVFRVDADPVFTEGTGLTGTTSDVVTALTLSFPPYFKLTNRALFDETFNFSRNEAIFSLDYAGATLNSSLVLLEEDTAQGAPEDRAELLLQGGYELTPNWAISGFFRQDLVEGSVVRAGGALSYTTDCVGIDVSVSRRFTTSLNVAPSTSAGLNIRVAEFSTGDRRGRPRSRCSKLARN